MTVLTDDYNYHIIDEDEFWTLFKANRKNVFQNNIESYFSMLISESEKDKIKKLSKNLDSLFKLFIKITCKDKLVGWTYGKQLDNETFEMVNTGIFHEHRGKGLYKLLLQEIFKLVQDKGFQKISSRHHASNNNIIVPKLQSGFIITGLEIDDKFGLLVKLTYTFNSTRKEITNFRIGNQKLNKELEKYLNIWE